MPLDAMADRLWRCTLRLFADLGKAPSIDELAVAIGWPVTRVKNALQELQERDLLGLDAAGMAIDYAYPFTTKQTGHTVLLGAYTLKALGPERVQAADDNPCGRALSHRPLSARAFCLLGDGRVGHWHIMAFRPCSKD